jgi:hypothetical protein
MGIRLINYVANQLQSPALYTDAFANRPPYGQYGRLFMSTDTKQIFQDLTTGWSLIADAGSGSGNLQQITANGNTTTYGIIITGNDLTVNGGGRIYNQSLTNGGVLFPSGGSGLISQDNTNFVWDATNFRLGLGTATPGVRLDVHSSSGINAQFNGTGTNNATLQLQNAGTSKWTIGNYYNSGNNDFNIYDNVNTTYRAQFLSSGYAIFPNSVIIGSTNRTSSYGFDVYTSAYFRSNIYNLNYLQGSVLFAGASGLINQNNSQLNWDNTNNIFGVGAIPLVSTGAKFQVEQSGTSNIVAIRRGDSSNTGSSRILFQAYNASSIIQNTGIVEAGLNNSATSGYLSLYAGTTGVNLKIYENTGNVLIGGTYTDTGQKLQISGETRSATYSTSANSKISENSGSVPAATATTIFSNFTTNGGSFVLVTGKTAAGDWFFDTVVVNNDNSATALSSQNGGGPPVRIYSVSTNNLRLTVATALSSFFCFGLSAKYS